MVIDAYSGLQKTTASHCKTTDSDLEPDEEDEAVIATSSGNAEVIAASAGLGRGLHIGYIAEELGLPVPKPIRIQIDATAAIGFLQNTGGAGRMKHLDIRKGWIQMARDNKLVEYHKVDGKLIQADFFTKLLDKTEYDRAYERLAYVPSVHNVMELD